MLFSPMIIPMTHIMQHNDKQDVYFSTHEAVV